MARRHVAVIADSTISLPRELLHQHGIISVPLSLVFRDRTYRDGVDLEPSAFYELLKRAPTPPTTSAPPPESFLQAYALAAEVAESAVCLTLASNLSATYHSARAAAEMAAERLPGFPIAVLDTDTAAAAEGLIALETARAALHDATQGQVLSLARDLMPRVRLLGFLDTLYYLWKGGRIPKVAGWMGTLLSIKPMLELANGSVHLLERPRTKRRAMERLLSTMAHHLDSKPVHAIVVHGAAPREAEELRCRVAESFKCRELLVSELTPIIGAHTGPGLVGCAFYAGEPQVVEGPQSPPL